MIPILYEPTETAFISNGVCRLRDCTSCIVYEERNGIYELDFEYPVGGANFEQIECGRIIAVRHDDTDDVQPFDIVSYTKPINGIVSFHAVHISYRLRGYVVEEENVDTLTTALNKLTLSTPNNNFTFQADFTASGYAGAFNGLPRTVRQLLGGVEGSILDTYGGEYEWDKFNVILHRSRGAVADFKIRYGLNMVDYNEEVDYSETYTSAVPYWVGDDGNGGETVVKGNKVDSGYVPYNTFEKCVPLDLSDKFENAPTSAELETLAYRKMTSQNVNLPKQSIQVDFIRLNDFDEYNAYAPLLQCKLCDSIEVIFPDYQTSGLFKIVRTEYDVLRERFNNMELGTLSTTLSEALGIGQSTSSQGSSGGGGGGGVTGVKGDAEATYRTGNVNLTAANIGALPSNTAIHNVPSGGTSGQVLAKASGTDYDLAWVNQSGASVTDVQVNGTSVVTNNVANVPVARSDRYGVIKGYFNTEPGGGVIGITVHDSSEQEVTGYAPISEYITGSGYQPIRAKFLPDVTQSTKGAMSAADKTKLDGIATGAEVNVQSNWTEADSSSDAYILNKPSLAAVATSGDYTDLTNTPAIPTFPVGSVYECTSNTNPSSSLGGTWAYLGTSEVTVSYGLETSGGDTLITSGSDTLVTSGIPQGTYKFERTA